MSFNKSLLLESRIKISQALRDLNSAKGSLAWMNQEKQIGEEVISIGFEINQITAKLSLLETQIQNLINKEST